MVPGMLSEVEQWYSTWGTCTPRGTGRHLRGYVKLKKKLFHDKHWIVRARFRVSHRRSGCKDIRFGSSIFSLSLPPLCDYRLCILCITWIIHQQLWGYKVVEKLYLGVCEQKRLNTTEVEKWVGIYGSYCFASPYLYALHLVS
jgi:hypothetical protein